MTTITRRNAVKGLAAMPLLSGTAIQATAQAADPLLDAIEGYRNGVRALNAMPSVPMASEDAAVDAVYGRHHRIILDWKSPALTRKGAIEALHLMKEEDVFMDDMGEPLRLAVLGFLENLNS